MKILFIGHYKEPTGWGSCAREEIKFLYKYYDLVIRSIDFKASVKEDWMIALEKKSLDGVTHVIQYVMPFFYNYYPNCKNIGYMELESSNINYSEFPEYFNLMDEMWAVNQDAEKTINKCCDVPTRVVHHPLNFDIKDGKYNKINVSQISGDFLFYNISEDIPRKNLKAIITAFNAEFDPSEPASLVIKTNRNIDKTLFDIKKEIRLYKTVGDYKKEVIISARLTDDQIYGVHDSCDCFIMPSCGESWCQPMFDAAVFNNQIIAPNIGPVKLLDNIIPCDYYRKYCVGNNNFLNYQNAWDTWNNIDECSLGESMRLAYNKGKIKQEYDLSYFQDEFKIKSMNLEKELK